MIKVQSMALCLILNVRLVLVRVVFILIVTQRLLQHGEAAYHVLGSSLRTAWFLELTICQILLQLFYNFRHNLNDIFFN